MDLVRNEKEEGVYNSPQSFFSNMSSRFNVSLQTFLLFIVILVSLWNHKKIKKYVEKFRKSKK